jgi:hypothetical protein
MYIECTGFDVYLGFGGAFAADQAGTETPISPNQGSDDCGLAWQVTRQKTLMGTFTRGTTNAYLSPTWSMTSGTSGCQKHELAKKEEQAVQYVAANFYPLTAEMAEGHGEYLVGLAQVMGCNDSVASNLGHETQRSFRSITNGADAYQTVQNIKQVIQKNPVLVQNCTLTI